MKKIDFIYSAKWYFVFALLAAVVLATGLIIGGDMPTYFIVSALVILALMFYTVPIIKNKAMSKKAIELEKGFQNNFKFTSSRAVFYIDTNGRLGVLWRGNPSQIQLANPSKITNIRTNDGKVMLGTSRVSCQFNLDEKPYRINTLLVARGQLSMTSPQVLEAIAKADKIGEMLNAAKSAAYAE